mgnify:CR=1 FL=1
MNYPPDLKPNIQQFSDDPTEFWKKFVAASPAPIELTEESAHIWHKQLFGKRYSYSFANVLGAGHPFDAYNLPTDVKKILVICMLTPSAP